MVVVPSHTASHKLLYVTHYKVEIGGKASRACRAFMWYLTSVPAPSVISNVITEVGCVRKY